MDRRHFIATGTAATAAFAADMVMGLPAAASVAVTGPRRPGAGRLDVAAFRALRSFVATPQGRIACVQHGSGPAALFLHGFPLNGFQWRDAIAGLAAHRRCIVPDFMGLGYTETADGQGVAPRDQVDMLAALLDALGVASADVISSDSGTAVAQLLAVQHPGRVRSLLLTNGDTQNDCPPPALLPVIELAKEGRFVDEWLAPWRGDTALARSGKGIGAMCYADPAHPTDEAIEYYFAPLVDSPMRKARTHDYAVALEANMLAGINAELARSTVPARVVWGMADDIFASASAPFELERAFGNSRGLRLLEGSKLFWPEERPEVVVEEALRLWGIARGLRA
ncbi:alpha/beta fold hydrolase [Luteimonas salinilitoris]|uniref:Alpha/beta fold hydrolase n=1 Tax=Luteimonas salinilitoris TaxID=3237697 RepID=A0ABV4HU74_9GAMM